MSYAGNPRTKLGADQATLGSGRTLTADEREAAFQKFLEAERRGIEEYGKTPPPTASWPIEHRRELWMRRYQ